MYQKVFYSSINKYEIAFLLYFIKRLIKMYFKWLNNISYRKYNLIFIYIYQKSLFIFFENVDHNKININIDLGLKSNIKFKCL